METRERLQNVFRDIFDDESIELFDEMTSDDIEDWDSLMHMNLIIGIEHEFNIKFTVEEGIKAENVGEFISMIEDKIKHC